MGIVAPTERHILTVKVNESVIGDGHAMGVTPEVGKHITGTVKRRFGVDDPIVLLQASYQALKRINAVWFLGARHAQITASVRLCEELKVLSTKHL